MKSFFTEFFGARRKNWFDFVVYYQYLTFLLLFFRGQEIKFTEDQIQLQEFFVGHFSAGKQTH